MLITGTGGQVEMLNSGGMDHGDFKGLDTMKRIDYPYLIFDNLFVLQILRIKDFGPALQGRGYDHAVPVGKQIFVSNAPCFQYKIDIKGCIRSF